MQHRVSIQAPANPATGKYNETGKAYIEVAVRWARVETTVQPAGEQNASPQVAAHMYHTITMWYFPGLTALHRFVWQNRVFAIIGPVAVDERQWSMTILCKERLGEVAVVIAPSSPGGPLFDDNENLIWYVGVL